MPYAPRGSNRNKLTKRTKKDEMIKYRGKGKTERERERERE
jgi:hypothetical protein